MTITFEIHATLLKIAECEPIHLRVDSKCEANRSGDHGLRVRPRFAIRFQSEAFTDLVIP